MKSTLKVHNLIQHGLQVNAIMTSTVIMFGVHIHIMYMYRPATSGSVCLTLLFFVYSAGISFRKISKGHVRRHFGGACVQWAVFNFEGF